MFTTELFLSDKLRCRQFIDLLAVMIHRVTIRLENVSNVEMPALSVCSLYYSIPKDLRFTCVTYFILYFFFC